MNHFNSSNVMTCLEHEQLSENDFVYSQDFAYLLQQDLPCFAIIFRAGRPYLLVKHYLAKLLMPSGVSIEILPKISTSLSSSNANSSDKRQHEIQEARQWVAQMLLDIARYDMQKRLPAINLVNDLASTNEGFNTDEQVGSTAFNNDVRQEPWYKWLLNLSSHKISAALSVIPRDYHNQAHNSPQARGKLNLSEQLKTNWHRPHYLYSEQSVLLTDKLLLRYLATGWQQLQRLNLSHPQTKYEAQHPHLLTQGTHTDVLNTTQALSPHLWKTVGLQLQQDKRYLQSQLTVRQLDTLRQGLAWCEWVLNHLTALVTATDSTNQAFTRTSTSNWVAPAVMINMNHAFERWVIGHIELWQQKMYPESRMLIQPKFDWLATEDCPEDKVTGTQDNSQYLPDFRTDCRIVQRLIPDVCILAPSGEITHVMDIKYKAIQNVQNINSTDWQQLFVYKQYLQANYAWLIYPMTASFKQKARVTKAATSKSISSFQSMHSTSMQSKTNSEPSVDASIKDSIESLNKQDRINAMAVVPFDIWRRELMI